ncbi:MAG: ThiF family adenylyltransferase [Burkholderiales bacterium]|nr:ThiF family adenylyltransferase [Phycisphaerae bacterium]
MTDPLSISVEEVSPEDRFDRFKLIGWWDQSRLKAAKVLVIGAGALGNEIIKNLALLGVGKVVIADKDTIENSNLSRSVLYRASDTGKLKADVAASAARDIYPDIAVAAINCDIIHDLGAGVYRWADIIIGGLDNREARLAINRQCWRVGRPWVDGAIEIIQGIARVFVPDEKQENPCYECTMSERDWKLLQHRRSCNLLTRAEMETGRVPTTPTIASVIAGVQVQETLKYLHGMPTLAGKGFVFAGDTADSYQIEYQRKADCLSHDTLGRIVELEDRSDKLSVGELLTRARALLGATAVLDLGRDIAQSLVCRSCQNRQDVFRSLGSLSTADARCPACAQESREVVTFNTVRGDEAFLDRTLRDIGLPRFDIITARTRDASIGFELRGDAGDVLGNLADEDLEWM